MSERETPGPDAGVGEDAGGQYEDPSDFNLRRRLESINNSRDQVLETMRTVDTNPSISGAEGMVAIHGVVKTFITDIEHLVRQTGEEEYWTKYLGDVTVHPPEVFTVPPQEGVAPQTVGREYNFSEVAVIGDAHPEPLNRSVHGLFASEDSGLGFLSLPSRIRESWKVPVQTRHESQLTISGSSKNAVPREVSEAAFRLGNAFLADHGLDARMEDDRSFSDYGDWPSEDDE